MALFNRLQAWLVCSIFILVLTNPVYACPDINGLVDVQCDGKVLILAFGDSITQGYLDPAGLGYPGRLAKLLKKVEVVNLGQRGENSRVGASRAQIEIDNFPDADYIILQEGANDYYDKTPSAQELKENLLKILKVAKKTKAYVLIGSLLPTKRAFQREWVTLANKEIDSLVGIDFFKLGTSAIGFDGLHPLGLGYQKMAALVVKRLKLLSKSIRPVDSDKDGLYDYEESRNRTNKRNPDTDGDGLIDGQEVWKYKTNPRLKDSDLDGLDDLEEIQIYKTNPNLADTDGDFISDGDEVKITFTDPLTAQ